MESVEDEDEITEKKFGSLPCALKDGIADAFKRFPEKNFEKYKMNNAQVSLQDAIRLTHPKPRNEQQNEVFKKVAHDELGVADTWESVISKEGSTKESWERIIPRMPYMATLRNLRNFLLKEVSDESLEIVLRRLTNEEEVMKSRQFPFRFLSAYRQIENIDEKLDRKTGEWEKIHVPMSASRKIPRILEAISTALDISVKNIPKLTGWTSVFADNSGSMSNKLSEKSMMARQDVANLMMAISHRISDDAVTGIFGTYFAWKKFTKGDRLLDNMLTIRNDEVGSNTNEYLSIDALIKLELKVNRILIFSDEQCYDSYGFGQNLFQSLTRYKRMNPDVYTYVIDLSGYGTAQFPEGSRRVCLLGGFTEKVLNFIHVYERDESSILKEIEAITV